MYVEEKSVKFIRASGVTIPGHLSDQIDHQKFDQKVVDIILIISYIYYIFGLLSACNDDQKVICLVADCLLSDRPGNTSLLHDVLNHSGDQ